MMKISNDIKFLIAALEYGHIYRLNYMQLSADMKIIYIYIRFVGLENLIFSFVDNCRRFPAKLLVEYRKLPNLLI